MKLTGQRLLHLSLALLFPGFAAPAAPAARPKFVVLVSDAPRPDTRGALNRQLRDRSPGKMPRT